MNIQWSKIKIKYRIINTKLPNNNTKKISNNLTNKPNLWWLQMISFKCLRSIEKFSRQSGLETARGPAWQ
jgi:hypothetical protein